MSIQYNVCGKGIEVFNDGSLKMYVEPLIDFMANVKKEDPNIDIEEVTSTLIFEYVELWHETACKVALYELLGMTKEEYEKWIKDDSSIIPLIERKNKE